MVEDETEQDNIQLSSCCCSSFNSLNLKTILSQMICSPSTPSEHFQRSFPEVSPCYMQPKELIFAALLQIRLVSMLDCSPFAFVSRLSDVKQLDGQSGHLLVSQKLRSISSFVCVKTLESLFLHSQLLNVAEWFTLVRQIMIPGSFSNQ